MYPRLWRSSSKANSIIHNFAISLEVNAYYNSKQKVVCNGKVKEEENNREIRTNFLSKLVRKAIEVIDNSLQD
jgi:hypothetical protein